MSRRLCLVALLIVAAVAGSFGCKQRSEAVPPGAKVRIRIVDRLGSGQAQETVTITLGGVTKTINLNEQNPTGYVDFYGPGPGRYDVAFSATTSFWSYGELVSVTSHGGGTVDCVGDATFEMVMDPSTNPPRIGLRPY